MNDSNIQPSQAAADLARAQVLIEEQRVVIAALSSLVYELMQTLADIERTYPDYERVLNSYPN